MRIIALTLSSLMLLSLTGAQAQDLKKGLKAYKSGDYATAIKEWRRPAIRARSTISVSILFRVRVSPGIWSKPISGSNWRRARVGALRRNSEMVFPNR